MSSNAISILKRSIENLKGEALRKNEELKEAQVRVKDITEEIILLTKRVRELEEAVLVLDTPKEEAKKKKK